MPGGAAAAAVLPGRRSARRVEDQRLSGRIEALLRGELLRLRVPSCVAGTAA